VYAVLLTVGAAVASFGFLTLVILGLALGGSLGGLLLGWLCAAGLGVAQLWSARWAWRRLASQNALPSSGGTLAQSGQRFGTARPVPSSAVTAAAATRVRVWSLQ
jgi:hypothetical protein